MYKPGLSVSKYGKNLKVDLQVQQAFVWSNICEKKGENIKISCQGKKKLVPEIYFEKKREKRCWLNCRKKTQQT